MRSLGEPVIFLLYHDIDTETCPSEKIDHATRETVCRREEFERHMMFLSLSGYHVLSVEQYSHAMAHKNLPSKPIVLTFDDGHISNYVCAFPVLKKFGFKATFYIVADRIGKPWHMNSDQLRELDEWGMEIASHGLTHTYLPLMGIHDIRKELILSKKNLEDCIGKKVKSFAYPGGHFTRSILYEVRKAGYDNAVSCLVGRNDEKTDIYRYKRIEMRRGTSEDNFQNALKPSTILFYALVDSVRRSFKHLVGLHAYQNIRKKLYVFYPFKR